MSPNWNLGVPALLLLAVAYGQVANTLRERKTGEVAWWAKRINVFGLAFPKIDYSDPNQRRMRHWENLILSAASVLAAAFVGSKFLGL